MAHDPNDNRPTLADLRAVVQPPEHIARYNAEHWSGALYMRHLSLRATLLLLRTGASANTVTVLMVLVGVLGAALLPLPGLLGPVLVVLAMQAQILLDCSDGEVARWRHRFSPAGIYLDRIGHYLTEAALPIFLGLRADSWNWRHPADVGGWALLGSLTAVVVIVNKAFTDLVVVSRAKTGRPLLSDTEGTALPKAGSLAAARRAFRYVPVFRAFVAVEFSLSCLVAGAVDVAVDGLNGSQLLLAILAPLAVITAGGHLVGVLTSSRLD
ncbi:CDP-alcohol phosphatidyltransferase family protein [Phycicoccus ginsengisoli]